MTSPANLCGRLIVAGFSGTSLSSGLEQRLRTHALGGLVLFRRNVESMPQVHALCSDIARVTHGETWIGVDQEGGRVARLPSPVLQLPTARILGQGSPEATHQAAFVLGKHLSSLGFNLNFAPVLDVDSNPRNPVIGDRSFASTPERVADFGCGFALGLQSAGVVACGKHFPGHGDTHQDSHKVLPVVGRTEDELTALELMPFAAAASAGVEAMMTAHVVYPAWDSALPATLSSVIISEILREKLRFSGFVFSDDLEMKGITRSHSVEDAAVLAIVAGCDAVLICHSEERQRAAHEALIHEWERSQAFRARTEESLLRRQTLLQRYPLRPSPSLDALHKELALQPEG